MTASNDLGDAADSVRSARGKVADSDETPPVGGEEFQSICNDIESVLRQLSTIAELGGEHGGGGGGGE